MVTAWAPHLRKASCLDCVFLNPRKITDAAAEGELLRVCSSTRLRLDMAKVMVLLKQALWELQSSPVHEWG